MTKDMRGIPSGAEIPGASLGIDLDGFFDLEGQVKRLTVICAGYIAVELECRCALFLGMLGLVYDGMNVWELYKISHVNEEVEVER